MERARVLIYVADMILCCCLFHFELDSLRPLAIDLLTEREWPAPAFPM